jgi:hypothetical protein
MNRILIAIVTTLFVAACDGGSKLSGMSDSELASKRNDCIRNNPTSPGRVTGCENIREECERRRKEGIYAC